VTLTQFSMVADFSVIASELMDLTLVTDKTCTF
jgi:hypothetical protein